MIFRTDLLSRGAFQLLRLARNSALVKILLAVVSLGSLVGCQALQLAYLAQLEQQARDEKIQRARELARRETQVQVFAKECRGFGFADGSPELKSCVTQLEQLDRIRQAEIDRQNQLQYRCRAIYSSRLLSNTSSGTSGESFNNAAEAYNACMAGLPIPKTGPRNFYCTPVDKKGGVSCQEQ